MEENRNFEETVEAIDNVAQDGGKHVAKLNVEGKVDTIIGAAIGAGGMLLIGAFVYKVAVPVAKEGVKFVGDKVHDFKFPKPDVVDSDAKEVDESDDSKEE